MAERLVVVLVEVRRLLVDGEIVFLGDRLDVRHNCGESDAIIVRDMLRAARVELEEERTEKQPTLTPPL